jgi:hypothetical protein
MRIVIHDDLSSIITDDAESPTRMLKLPSYNLSTLKAFVTESEAMAQCKQYAGRLELFVSYVSPEEEATALLAEQTEEMRATRNQLLKSCDWTQVADAPIDKEAWATYRQALRDITTHANFPSLEAADWPVAP